MNYEGSYSIGHASWSVSPQSHHECTYTTTHHEGLSITHRGPETWHAGIPTYHGGGDYYTGDPSPRCYYSDEPLYTYADPPYSSDISCQHQMTIKDPSSGKYYEIPLTSSLVESIRESIQCMPPGMKLTPDRFINLLQNRRSW